MRLVVGPFEPFCAQMGVYLSGDQVGVAEEFLDAAQVSAGIKHVRSVAMAQFVRSQGRVQSRYGQVSLEP